MQDQATQLRRVIAAVERIQRSCRGANLNSRPLCLSDITPKLDLPAVHTSLPTALSNTLGGIQRTGIVRAIEHSIGSFRQDALIAFRTTVRHLRSLEDVTGVPDSTLEQRHCSLFETRYFQHIESVREHVREAVWAYVHAKGGEASKKGNGFGPHATTILETAFAHRPVLTTRENSIIAEAAGITHQQVRTWFQNRRNRKKSGERRTASHSEVQARATESVIPPERRVISALPKRAAPSTNLDPPPPHSTRPTRGLPRRAQHVSPSPTPSVSSASSLESILPSGGFTAPVYPSFPLAQPSEIAYSTLAIPYTGAETPAFNFTPPTPLNADFNFDADMNFNIDDILPPWSTADFTSLLNSVLAEPTLAGSPTFTTPPSTNPPDEVEEPRFGGMEGWPQDGLGDDFLAMLNGFVDYPASSDNADSSLASSPMSVQTSDVTSTGPRSIEASPLDLLQPAPTSADPCSTSLPASPSSKRSRSSSESLITPIHPRILSRSTSEPIVATYTADAPVDPSAWMSGVLALDCVGGEWEGYEEKIQLGGEWDFSGILGMQADGACS